MGRLVPATLTVAASFLALAAISSPVRAETEDQAREACRAKYTNTNNQNRAMLIGNCMHQWKQKNTTSAKPKPQ